VPQDTVPIHQSAWKAGGEGPINLGGGGMYMYGSEQPKPSPLPWWIERNDAIERQREQSAREQQNQIFNQQEIRQMIRNPTKEAFGAIEAAQSYEARMNFNNALNAGMPVQEAYARYGSGMNRPSRGMQQAMQPEVNPELINLGPGMDVYQSGPRSFRQIRQPAPEPGMSTTDQIRVAEAYLKDIDAQLKIVRNPFYTLPDKNQKITALETQRKEVMSGIGPAQPAKPVVQAPVLPRQMPAGRPAGQAGQGIPMKDKRTGKIVGYYRGRREDIPTDKYDIGE